MAAVLAFITCAGHTVGTFMAIPPEQTAMLRTIGTMRTTMVPMPVGAARSYLQILDGNNLCTSLFLLLCALNLLNASRLPEGPAIKHTVVITSLALAGFSIVSARYFFPVPTVLTAVAALLGWIALSRPHPSK
jgi:hypothetical protein